MPWSTPSLADVRKMTRDRITATMNAVAIVPNSVLRVMADAMSALAYLTLEYIDWLALQLLPDTSETEWLDRHGSIWLTNADGSKGRKVATFATGPVAVTGINGAALPAGSQLVGLDGIGFETIEEIEIGTTQTQVMVRALDAGVAGNRVEGDTLSFNPAIPNIDGNAVAGLITGGTDEETDDELRARVLERIQQPPMGGDRTDYIAWAKAVPGVTRAWCYPQEMGIGTVTVRFMCDDTRAAFNGFPQQEDIDAVTAYIDTVRPVCVKDYWVVAPIPFPINFTISNLETDDADTRAAIETSVREMMHDRVIPGQEVYKSWISEAISRAIGEDHHDLEFENTPMPSMGYLPVLGTISYGG